MIRKNLKTLIITSIIILLPVVAGIVLWDSLPEQIAIHWNIHGTADGYTGKAGAVFTLPLVILGTHLFCIFATNADPKKASGKVLQLVFWICPALSLLLAGITYTNALGVQLPVGILAPLILGILFLVIGNYLPKCKQNYTIGIKVPWALNDAENWNKTHRFAGILWVIGGLFMILTAFFNSIVPPLVILILITLAPVIYSYCLYRKQNKS